MSALKTTPRASRTVILAVLIGGIAVIALVFLRAESPSSPELPTYAPDGRTGNEAVDKLIDGLLTDNAEQLSRKHENIAAREGAPIGGPVGLGNGRTVGTEEWTTRLGSGNRSLHSVFRAKGTDRTVPQQGPPFDTAGPAVDPGFDFYVVLSVDEGVGVPNGWRFGVTDGRVVNLIITGSPYPNASYPGSPLALEPSPVNEFDRFVVLPPEADWPAPTPVPRQAINRDPSRSPTFAPGGRTGDPSIDEVIGALLTLDAGGLARLANVAAREQRQVQVPNSIGSQNSGERRVPLTVWTERLARSARTLYAVINGEPMDVILAVDSGGRALEAWTFALRGDSVVEVAILSGYVPPPNPPFELLTRSTPPVWEASDRFLVLPPEDQLPKPPPGYELSVRTGDEGVDRLLAMLEAHDWDRVRASVAGQTLAVQESCGDDVTLKQASEVEGALSAIVHQVSGVFAVANPPEGSPRRAEHVIVLWIQERPYHWTQANLLERGGEIVGIGCIPPAPPVFIVPPPAGGLAGLSPSRRSGVRIVDAVLNAIQSRNETALASLIDFSRMACPGEYGPPCLPGEAPGTLVEVLPGAVCHGEYPRRDQAASYLLSAVSYLQDQRLVEMSLYAVMARRELGTRGFDLHSRGTMSVLLAAPDGSTVLLGFSEDGVTNWSKKCGPPDPEPVVPPGPVSFLLPPR